MAVIFLLGAGTPEKGDVFLDKPFSEAVKREMVPVSTEYGIQQMLPIPSFAGGVHLLEEMSGKTVLLTEGIASWPDEQVEKNWGIQLGAVNKQTVRELFERLCMQMGMTWEYHADQDAIILDPKWRRDDPRSAAELLAVLSKTTPVPDDKLTWSTTPNRVGGHDQMPDEWRAAFDALVSKPENLPSAGTLRLYDDAHAPLAPMGGGINNLFAAKMTDADGHPEILVINGAHMPMTGASPGDINYYLFDENGRFIKGGDYSIAKDRSGGIANIKANGTQGITINLTWGKWGMGPQDHLHFALANGDLVLTGYTDSHGKNIAAQEIQATDPKLAVLKYSISGPQ
jgi:hypothetical protein